MRGISVIVAIALVASCTLTRSVDDLSSGSHGSAACGGKQGCAACDSCMSKCACFGASSDACAAQCGSSGGTGGGTGGGPELCTPGNCAACNDCVSSCSCFTGDYAACQVTCNGGTGGTSGTGGAPVDASSGGTGAASGSGGTGTGGSGGSGGTGSAYCGYFADTNCVLCVQALCCQEDIACANDDSVQRDRVVLRQLRRDRPRPDLLLQLLQLRANARADGLRRDHILLLLPVQRVRPAVIPRRTDPYRPICLAMITFMISLVPAKMRCTRASM